MLGAIVTTAEGWERSSRPFLKNRKTTQNYNLKTVKT